MYCCMNLNTYTLSGRVSCVLHVPASIYIEHVLLIKLIVKLGSAHICIFNEIIILIVYSDI